ncbi:MFS transporter [Actinomadura kijaniata]|uniref:MFS transporter n=1 Tax=Actinomadura kijaniata TaxID=46161 RepID=UPI003F1952AA
MPEFNPMRDIGSLVPEPGPKRAYALATFVNMFGFGLLIVSMGLYFTRIVKLPAAQVGLALTIGVSLSLLSSVPIGQLADRRGPLETTRIMLLVQCGTAIAILFVDSFLGLVAAATADVMALSASVAASESLMRRVGGEDAVGFRTSVHAIQNLGIGLGTVGCGVVIQIGTPTAYHVMIILDALSFLVAWAVLGRLPHYAPLPKPATAPRWGVLADRPFVAYTALAGAMNLQFYVINMLLPLWVADVTDAPPWSIAVFYLINNAAVVVFQVRVGGRVRTVRQGGSAFRRAGLVFLFSCLTIGLAADLPGWAALMVLTVGVCVHTYGELWHMAGSFALNFGLPPAHAQGQYQGFLGIGTGVGDALAPLLFLSLILGLGRPGLLGIGVFFALTGLLMPAVARWGERTRTPAATDAAGPADAGATGEAAEPGT